MKGEKKDAFASSADDSAGVHPVLQEAISAAAPQGLIGCAEAFSIAAKTSRPPAEVGEALDRLRIRLVKCQLGLFGYTPDKKIVNAAPAVKPELALAIQHMLQGGKLPCHLAWDLAKTFQLPRMAVSAACEALGVKIKPCQLGAF
jgi:hypothetical protein